MASHLQPDEGVRALATAIGVPVPADGPPSRGNDHPTRRMDETDRGPYIDLGLGSRGQGQAPSRELGKKL